MNFSEKMDLKMYFLWICLGSYKREDVLSHDVLLFYL